MAAHEHTTSRPRDKTPKTHLPEYGIWVGMKRRCLDPGACNYRWYGARGVLVCERWLNSFEAFYEDMGCRPSLAHSLDRRDSAGHYEPGNCRWVTNDVQQQNKLLGMRYIEFAGQRRTLTGWAEEAGMSITTLSMRLARGWSFEDALTIPVREGQKPYHYKTRKLKGEQTKPPESTTEARITDE